MKIEYYVVKTGKPIKLGDTYREDVKKEFSFGTYSSTTEMYVTEQVLKHLLKEDKVKVREVVEKKYDKTLNYFIANAAEKLDMKEMEFAEFFDLLVTKYPLSAVNLLLAEISEYTYSLEPNKAKYSTPTRYVVTTKGEVKIADKNLAGIGVTFLTREEADYALGIVKPIFEFVHNKFYGSKQKD